MTEFKIEYPKEFDIPNQTISLQAADRAEHSKEMMPKDLEIVMIDSDSWGAVYEHLKFWTDLIDEQKMKENATNTTDLDAAATILRASNGHITEWSGAMRLYGDHKYKNIALGKCVKELRESFYHDGSKEAIQKFWKCHDMLERMLQTITETV